MVQQNFKNTPFLKSSSRTNFSQAMPKTSLSRGSSNDININKNKQVLGVINYKNIGILRNLINLEGKILSHRITALQNKKQKQTAKSIKRSRILGLLPFVHKAAPSQRKLRKKVIRYKPRSFARSRRNTRRS